MTDAQFNDLDRFVAYADKQFQRRLLAGCFGDGRADPDIPFRAVGLSLLLGEVVRIPSLLQLEQETNLPQWQRWVGYPESISHDTFGYASNRMNPAALALTAGKPTQVEERGQGPNRHRVEIWDVRSLRLSDTHTDPVRVVRCGRVGRSERGGAKQW